MKIVFTSDDGTVLDAIDTAEIAAELRAEFGSEPVERETIIESVMDAVRHDLTQFEQLTC
jgi:hypothetical protein